MHNKSECTLFDKWAIWIIGLSITAFLLCSLSIAIITFHRRAPIQRHLINVSQVDSINENHYNQAGIDSLIQVVSSHEELLYERYQYIIEEKAKEESTRTLGTFIIGIVLSVCGFFGYKSFHDVKRVANNVAQETAQETVKSELPALLNSEMTKFYKNQPEDVLKEKIKTQLTMELQDYIDQSIEPIKSRLDEIDDRIQKESTLETKGVSLNIETHESSSLEDAF